MRYWILVALLNGLFTLIIHFAAPEMFGSTAYYAGVTICALIALVITWSDPPDMLENVLFFVFKWGILAAGVFVYVWVCGYFLGFWGEYNQDKLVSSAFDNMVFAVVASGGALILCGGLYGWISARRG